MNSLIGSVEGSDGTLPSAPRTSLPILRLFVLGVPVTACLAFVDHRLLEMCSGRHAPSLIPAAYILFVAQTGLLATLVGSQVRRHPFWWAFLVWGVLLVDIQAVTLSAGFSSEVTKLAFAFASAQLGMVTCYLVLGATVWRIRLLVGALCLTFVLFFGLALGGSDAWQALLMLQTVATAIACGVLRWFSFRIQPSDLDGSGEQSTHSMQFSIRHLFYWTTGVAIMVGIGRGMAWQPLLMAGLQLTRTQELFVIVPLLTFTSVVALWAVLGCESWLIRIPVFLISLPAAGFVLGISAPAPTRPWWGETMFREWGATTAQTVAQGIFWMVLAGALLASLLLAFRASANRLQRTRARTAIQV